MVRVRLCVDAAVGAWGPWTYSRCSPLRLAYAPATPAGRVYVPGCGIAAYATVGLHRCRALSGVLLLCLRAADQWVYWLCKEWRLRVSPLREPTTYALDD